MKVKFLSLDDQNEKNYFESDASRSGQDIIFLDKTTPNTTIEFSFLEDSVKMIRTGDVNSFMEFKLNETTKGKYHNLLGLEFDFNVLCTKLEVADNKIRIDYILILDEYIQTNHKISLLILEK